jgi:hypothetical protein
MIKLHRNSIFPVFLYGYETWSPVLRDERGLRVFEIRVLRKIFWLKRDDVRGSAEEYIRRYIKICTHHQITFG